LVLFEQSVRGQRYVIEETLRRWCDVEELDVVITLGGTAPAPGAIGREVTPEATVAVLESQLPGMAEAMRSHASQQSTLAWLDRSVAGIRGRSLILNLPAGAAPALLFLTAVIELIAPLVAHLREETDAPRLVDELELANVDDTVPLSGRQPATANEQASGGKAKGLNVTEFAAFLQRGRNAG
jgi:molybdopterin adenylyltransferase